MKNSEPEDKQKWCRLDAKYNKYTLHDIVPRLIIEARPALPYTTIGLIFVHILWKCGPPHLKHGPGSVLDFTTLITCTSGMWKSALE